METALITGGLGFIGSYIARVLIEENVVEKAVLVDHYGAHVSPVRDGFVDYRKARLAGIEDRIIIERGEAKYLSVVSRLLDSYRPKYIFHLAALPLAKLQNLNTEEAQEGSVTSTSNILTAIGTFFDDSGYRPERFVYTSSSMVYGDFHYNPADENHPTNPKEIYGTMKLAGEAITRGLATFFGIPYTIIRPSAVYGPTDMNRRVTQIFVEKALQGQKLTIHGEDEMLDFTFVRDLAKGFVLAAQEEQAVGETFNITCGNARRLLDFALELKTHFPSLEYEVIERDAFRPRRGSLSIEKAQKLLGYKPEYDLKRGVSEYINFAKKHFRA